MQQIDEPAIQTEALSHRFGSLDVLRDLSMEVPRGAICGLLGSNGCGKTTLFRLLIGMLYPRQGSSRVLGLDPLRDAVEIRLRVGYMPQESDYDPAMTVQQTIDFIRPLYGDHWNETEFQRQLTRFNLVDLADLEVEFLSVGMRQRLALAITLAPEPELLLLDEPTAGLDAIVRRDFAEAVVEYMSIGNRTVVLSSHLLNDIERLVDYVIVLEEGRQLLAAPLDDLKEKLVRLEVTMPEHAEEVELPDVLSQYRVGNTLYLAMWNDDSGEVEVVKQRLKASGGEVVEVGESNLDSIFVDLMRS
ncbi:MAG: ABC transporter ATP-binding protein [Deltaproteobacteria bacterium]|nr:ABC transporter ATP-binding protein [Deltaproteobacteria bacterium]